MMTQITIFYAVGTGVCLAIIGWLLWQKHHGRSKR
jgi:hypothetical protein